MVDEMVIGVVLEVGVARGVDLLAVYANRSARYESCAGATVAWDRPDGSLDPQIDALLKASEDAVDDTAPLDPVGVPAVRFAEARITILLPEVTRAVQGPIVAFAGNPRLGALLHYGSALMRALAARAGAAVSV
jgi:hypothetical protein